MRSGAVISVISFLRVMIEIFAVKVPTQRSHLCIFCSHSHIDHIKISISLLQNSN